MLIRLLTSKVMKELWKWHLTIHLIFREGRLTSVTFKVVNASFLASFHFFTMMSPPIVSFFPPQHCDKHSKVALSCPTDTLKLQNYKNLVKQGFKISWFSHYHKSLGSFLWCNVPSVLQHSLNSSFNWYLLTKGKGYWHIKTTLKPLLQ